MSWTIWNLNLKKSCNKDVIVHTHWSDNLELSCCDFFSPHGIAYLERAKLNALQFDGYQKQCASESLTSIWNMIWKSYCRKIALSSLLTPSTNIITMPKKPKLFLSYPNVENKIRTAITFPRSNAFFDLHMYISEENWFQDKLSKSSAEECKKKQGVPKTE